MYVETFEDTFGSCTETLSYNESHVGLSCSNTHDFCLVDGTSETDGRKIRPQGMGDFVNIYNEDMILVVSSSINTKESTNFCTLDLPTPVTKVDHERVNGKLLLLFFSSQGLYQYDTSKPCIDGNLITLLNETLLGLNGDYQNYIIFGDLLVYTVMKNELHSSRGINLSTSENLGILANHQNHPLLYGFSFDDIVFTTSTVIAPTATSSSEPVISTSTSTVASVSNTTSSSTGMVTMTTSTTFSNTSMHICTLTSVTMTSTPSTTDPEGQSKPQFSSSFVTINTKESTNFCTLDLPAPVTRVDYARVNGKLLLLFFSYQGIYQYDTSTSCVNENLVTLVNATLLGLNGDYQNYLMFGDLLVYTVMKNGPFLSRGIDLSTSQDLSVFANHQNYPLLYGIIYDNNTVTMPTNTVITTSSELIIPTLIVLTSTSTTSSTVTMTTNSDFSSNPASTSSALTSSNAVTMTTNSVFSSASISTPLSISITTSSSFISTSAFSTTVTMTTATPSRTNSENIESEPESESMDSLPFLLGIISFIFVCITVSFAVLITILWYCYRYRIKKNSSSHPTVEAIQMNNLQPSSANSSSPQMDTTSVGSTDYITPIQAQQTSCSSLPVNPSGDWNTNETSTLSSYLSLDRIQSSREQQDRNTKYVYQSGQLDVSHDKKDSLY